MNYNKIKMMNTFRSHVFSYICLSILFVFVTVSCEKSENKEVLVADFTFRIDASKPNYVTLINATQGDYDRISWTYNDEEITGENIDQVEIYFPLSGSYDVVLHAYKDNFESTITKQISIAQDVPDEPTELTLVWSDEFNGSSVNRDDWNFETGATGWGNEELQNYTDGDNAEVSNGTLKIIARKENDDKVAGSYTSSRITSKKNFLYGRLEARAKMPTGKGVWPAFWMLGTNIYTAGYPACGEIDIMEYVGYEPDFVHASIHTTASIGTSENSKTASLETAEEDFHIYGIVWNEESIAFYLDDPANVFYTYSPENKTAENWPFDKHQFFILNLAVGGTWGGYEGIDNSIFPQNYEIDYVRVYQ